MTNTEKIDRLRNMAGAYTIYSDATRMPYVECEPADFYDIAYVFDTREDAEDVARKINGKGNPVRVVELKSLEIEIPAGEQSDAPKGKFFRNQLREHLMKFPTIGLNAISYKAQGDDAVILKLADVLPQEVKEKVDGEVDELSVVKLTGIYYSQYLHCKERDTGVLRDLSEEFYNNLTNSYLFMPVVAHGEQADSENPDISKCQLPCFALKNADSGKTFTFLALFTSMDEVAAYCRNNPAKARIAKVSFEGAYKLLREPMIGCVIDPMSINIPVRREDMPKLIEAGKNRILS